MSIEVTDELVARVATLSRLQLSDEEARGVKEHFEKVLQFVDDLQQLDLEGVDPSLFSLEASNVDRADEIKPSLSNADALRAAPRSDPPYFVVPRIVGEPVGGEDDEADDGADGTGA